MRQNKIITQAAKIAMVKAELNKALQENKKLKDLFNPDKNVEAMTIAVGAMTMKDHPKNLRALSTKVTLIMKAGSNSPSWHVVQMGC